jgi:protein-tyrosine phosphatase
MVDIHCHILPGLDDGPETLEQSIAMVKVAHAAGTTDIVATPHSNPSYTFDPELIALKIAELERATDSAVRLHTGCDFHLSATNIQDALLHPTKYTINHLAYLLVEFADFSIPPSTGEIFDRLRSAGMLPIITHPERNALLQERPDEIRSWVERDCLVQVTAQSFLGRFGKRARAFSEKLLRDGLVHIVASDAHDAADRTPSLLEAYAYVATNFGETQAQALFVRNPEAVLRGGPVEPWESEPKKRKWYHF